MTESGSLVGDLRCQVTAQRCQVDRSEARGDSGFLDSLENQKHRNPSKAGRASSPRDLDNGRLGRDLLSFRN